jgi:hypothetical protein
MPRELSAKQPTLRAAKEGPERLPLGSREAHERALDETLAETFPASDPLSSIPDPASDDPLAA